MERLGGRLWLLLKTTFNILFENLFVNSVYYHCYITKKFNIAY
ncbi:MAG: hypothetical protein QXQ50_09185 [Candidatus Bathyarchaeia archaeon]